MKTRTISYLLACAIQFSPAARLFCHTSKLLQSNFAIISKWSAGLAAVMGSLNAVSGASTVITSPSTASGKVGETFSYRITTAPDQANTFLTTTLPQGLALGTTKTTRSFILGTPSQAGVFDVTITASDSGRRDRTVSKLLRINIEPNGTPPAILAGPKALTVDQGGEATFSVSANSTTAMTYQWFLNGVPIPGATDPQWSLPHATTADTGSYHVLVSNASGDVESSSAQLVVNGPPYISTQPIAQRIPTGQAATLSVEALGPDPISFQWMKDGEDMAGQTGSTLSIQVMSKDSPGDYSVRIRNAYGEVVSEPARLSLDYGISVINRTLCDWSDVWSFEQSGLAQPSDWMDVGFDDSSWETGSGAFYVESASLPVATMTPLTLGAATYYFRKTFTIDAAIDSANLTLSSLVDDGYLLYLNGTLIHRLGMDAGVVNHETLANRSVGDAVIEGPFTGGTSVLKKGTNVLAVEVHQSSLTSSDVVLGVLLEAELNVPNQPPYIVNQTSAQTLQEGDDLVLTVEAGGTGPLEYQWQFNGVDLSGQNHAILTLSGISVQESGVYSLVVSNTYDSIQSREMRVEVLPVAPTYLPIEQVRIEQGMYSFRCELARPGILVIEYTDNLAEPVWNVMEKVSLQSGTHDFSYEINTASPVLFYRVRQGS